MLKTFCGLVTPPYLILRRGEDTDGISGVSGYAWSLTTEAVILLGRGNICVCVCVCVCVKNFGILCSEITVNLKLQSYLKNCWAPNLRKPILTAYTGNKVVQPVQEKIRLWYWGRIVNQCTYEQLCLHIIVFTLLWSVQQHLHHSDSTPPRMAHKTEEEI